MRALAAWPPVVSLRSLMCSVQLHKYPKSIIAVHVLVTHDDEIDPADHRTMMLAF